MQFEFISGSSRTPLLPHPLFHHRIQPDKLIVWNKFEFEWKFEEKQHSPRAKEVKVMRTTCCLSAASYWVAFSENTGNLQTGQKH